MLSVRNVENPDDLWIGVAQQNGTDIIGVFATDQGPVFFVNKQRYLLNGNEWDFSVKQKNTQNNTFRFVYNKVVVYEANYKRVTELGVHPYADEEFMDFYTWMTKKKISKTFIQYYTE
ncbi:MAG TPA: hypothetical protein DDW50_02395 [Firmicutes bacterium]|nr:hypothetical protein [Bacillota bacterium]